MKNLSENRTARQAAYIIAAMIFCFLFFSRCQKAIGQVRITGAFGVSGSPAIVSQLNIGYEFKGWNIQTDIMADGVNAGVYHGIKGGYIIRVNDNTQLQPYTGIMRKSVGNNNSQDRYIKDGNTTVLFNNLPVNTWNVPVGMQIVRQHLFIDAGAMAGKQITFFITIGVTHLFSN